MCGGCRQKGRRTPLVITLAEAAHNKYQQYQARQRVHQSDMRALPTVSGSQQTRIPDEKNEKLGESPPSYDTIVNNAAVPAEPALAHRHNATQAPRGSISSDDGIHSIDQASLESAKELGVMVSEGMTLKQAYKARKAEKRELWRAEKAEWKAMKRASKGKGCCC